VQSRSTVPGPKSQSLLVTWTRLSRLNLKAFDERLLESSVSSCFAFGAAAFTARPLWYYGLSVSPPYASAVVLVYRAIGLGSLTMSLELLYDVLFEHHSETGTSGGLLKRQDVPWCYRDDWLLIPLTEAEECCGA